MKWTPELRTELETRWDRGEAAPAIREAMGLTVGQLNGRITKYNLHRSRTGARSYNPDHPSVREARTRYPGQVGTWKQHLQPGFHSVKLGGRVEKGRWAGMPIYALTLEERATCPRDCALFAGCYGNGMQWAKRSKHGAEFELTLWRELHTLNRRHRLGFVVRLHVLGDFYSPSYVDLWEAALDHFENLRVFGYTARKSETVIGSMVQRLRHDRWQRFSVRTSGAQKGIRTTVIDRAEDCPRGAIICPAQTGKTRSCATCSLCWSTTKPIAFLRH